MKDIKRCISTGFWKDDKVLNDFSPEDKYFMLYLLTNPHTTQLGIYHLPLKVAAVELGYSIDAINVLLDRFENKYNIIRYSKDTNEVAIKNFLRYSIVSGGKPVMDCLEKEYDTVKDTSLIPYVLNHLNTIDTKYLNTTVVEFIKKYIGISNDNDNDNDNDNERYVDESYHESSKKCQPRAKQPIIYYADNPIMDDTFKAYLDMRKQIKKPASERAIRLVMSKLENLSEGNDDVAIDILNQSILNSWQDIYPLKTGTRKQPQQSDWLTS